MGLKVVRYSVGLNPVLQDNKAAPAKKGYWAFFEGFECLGIVGRSVNPILPKKFLTYDQVKDLPSEHPLWQQFSTEREKYWESQKRIEKLHLKRHVFSIEETELIYCGWLPDGTVTRSGFFNSGPWQVHPALKALQGLKRQRARAKALALKHEVPSWKSFCDDADWQIFIPTK